MAQRRPASRPTSRSARREAVGSWLEGPAAATRADDDYPGRRLGLPQSGPGSVARFGRRLVALFVDWGLSLLVARGLLDGQEWTTLGVFALEQVLLVATLGGSLGHLLLGLRVVRLDGTAAGPARALGRAVLLSLAVPALIWDRDQRGMHDRFMGTVLRRV
jgi:uncharacterized RDD family membrane protein YckC